jgi:uncharacterized protein YfaS (alpha-2-macroglobulin family)
MEQTSSASYPNVLIVDYLKKARVAKPEMMMKAMQMINVGYQKMLTFQTPSGGLAWWNAQDTPQVWVTAYGMFQLLDTARVYEIDPQVIQKAQNFLISKQGADGSWTVVGQTHGEAVASFKDPAMALTGYIAWALAESKYVGPQLDKAIAFLKKGVKKEENLYTLALAAAALLAKNPKDQDGLDVLSRIDDAKKVDGEMAHWEMTGNTMSYARGRGASVELTALVAYTMIQAGAYPGTAQKAMNYIIHAKSSSGHWGSTQSTILALKALVAAMSGKEQKDTVKVRVSLNGQKREIAIAPDQSDVLQMVVFDDFNPGTNVMEIESEGESSSMYQVVSRHFLPWSEVKEEEKKETIEFKTTYDRTQLSKADLLGVNVSMKYHGTQPTYMVIVDLGIPAGFDPLTEAFDKMLADKKIEKYNLTGRTIVLYFGAIKPGDAVEFSYQLKPRYPVKIKTPESQAYEYYTPDVRTKTRPVEVEVKE